MTRIAKDAFRMNGVPACRQVLTTADTAVSDLSMYAQDFIDALTVPRTEAEAASGTYKPPTPPRMLMTGTYDEVQAFFEGDLSRFPDTATPIAWLTDGSCIVPPTEERVAKMLTGTSHSPDEIVREKYSPKELWCTVEKVAVNAVMAGCKPEYLPVALTLAESGCCRAYPGDTSVGSSWVVSGPIAKEIGMNSWFCMWAPGNPANTSLSRCATLMGINLGGLEMGLTNPNRTGNNIWSLIYAEATDKSPWIGLNEDRGFGADQSVLVPMGSTLMPYNRGAMNYPVKSLKELQVSTPQIVVDSLKSNTHSSSGMVQFCPQTAWIWHDEYGFETMQELKDYLWDNVTWTVGMWKEDYWVYGVYDKIKDRPRGERIVSLDHWEMPDDAIIPLFTSPDSISIVVAGGDGDCWSWGGGGSGGYLIDKWR